MLRASTWALMVVGLVGTSPAHAQLLRRDAPDGNATVQASTAVLNELAAIPLSGIPQSLLARAEGVVICPNVIKAGFVLGGRFGHGVLLVKTADGGWSNPVFLRLTGGSIGWQAGVSSTDVVLVLATRKGVDGVLQGQRFTLGADASIAAGPVGRTAAAGTDATLQSEIFSYSRSRGLFAGVSLDGSALTVDPAANGAYYGRAGITPGEILAGANLAVPETAALLRAALAQHSAPVAATVPAVAPAAAPQPVAPQPVAPLAPLQPLPPQQP